MKPLAERMGRIQGEEIMTVLREAKALEDNGKSILHFEIGQPDFPTPEHIKKAGIEAIENNFTRYTITEGIPDFVL